MERGKTVGLLTKDRFTFTLFLLAKQGTPNITGGVTHGTNWNINWRSLIPQDVPRNAKFKVTHSFVEENFSYAAGGALEDNAYVVVQGLNGIQTYCPWTVNQPPGTIINTCRFEISAFTGLDYAGSLVGRESSFICAHPGVNTSVLSLLFYDMSGVAPSPTPTPVVDGVHKLVFELVSDY